MKIKRLLPVLLSIVMVLQLFPVVAQAAVVSESAAYQSVKELEAGRAGAPENTITSINNFNVVGGKISFDLNITSTLPSGISAADSAIDAVVMSAADYTGSNHANSPNKVNGTNYNSSGLLEVNATYWRSGTATVTADFKAAFASLGANLPLRTMAVDNTGNLQVTDNDCYYDDYVLILFNAGVGATLEDRYVVKKFQVDSQGNLKADSYMVRYVKNTASIGTTAAVAGTVAPQITKPSTVTTTLSTGLYTRTGYTFIGWDEDPQFLQKKGTGTVAANNIGTDYVNSLATMSDADAKNGIDYPSDRTNTTIPPQTKDSIYNLYAQWKPIKVNLTPVTARPGGAALETKSHDQSYDAYQAKVNKQFAWEFNVAGANSTDKGIIIETVREVLPGTETVISGADGTMTKEKFLERYGLAVANASSASVSSAGGFTLSKAASGKAYLTGTPKIPTENDLLVTIRTWDKTNFSYATQVLRIKGIAKGAQPVPTLDANTGLQSRVVTGDSGTDGQIFGFYSAGPTKSEETGYLTNTDGTGTMSTYYINNRMIYRYRPILVDGQEVDHAGLPNDGWREVPMPSNWYTVGSNKLTQAQYNSFEASLKKNATTVIKTKYDISQNRYAPIDVLSVPAGFTGWPDSYGWIEYDGTLPVIHGLNADDIYEVHFRENDSYGESDPQQISIGGAVASSGGGSGLAVNLAGGEWKESDAEAAKTFVDAAAALTAGGTLDIPTIEPVRTPYQFAGWTLGERDEDGRLILYRHPVPPAVEPQRKTATVTWIDPMAAEGSQQIKTDTVELTAKDEVPESAYPETTPPDYDTETVHKTFDKWEVGAPVIDVESGDITITITATFKDKTPITYIWVDDAIEGENKEITRVANAYAVPAHPADPPSNKGEAPFKGWVAGKPETSEVDGVSVTTVTFTATYKEKITYIWVDPLIELDDETPTQTVKGPVESYDLPEEHPADPSHAGAEFKGWVAGKPETSEVDGVSVTTVTIVATYEELTTYIWVDPLKEPAEGEETPNQTIQTMALKTEPTEDQYPSTPNHGEDHPFKGWDVGKPETVDGKTTVTITATYKVKTTYIWIDPMIELVEGNDTVTQKVYGPVESFDLPAHPEQIPSHAGVDFRGWEVGKPETDEDGKTTVTITATYGHKVTYVWVDRLKVAAEGEDPENKTIQTLPGLFDEPAKEQYPADPSHEGWNFTGWTKGEPETNEETGVTTVTFAAQYNLEKFKVLETPPTVNTFPACLAAVWEGGEGGAGGLAVNLAGGRWADADAAQAFVDECYALMPGGSVTIPEITPVKQYYEFAGWTLGEFGADGALITFQKGDTVTLGNEPSSLAAVWNATTEAFFPIVFYDWDGVTMLGTKIVPIVADVATQERLIDDAMREFAESQMSLPNAEAYRAAGYDPALGTDEAFYNESKPLSNKKGYTFGKWIDFDAKDENGNEVYTSYGAAVSVSSAGTMADELVEPAGHVFTEADRTNGITVKAAYRTNANMVPLTENTDFNVRNYVIETDSYTRFASSANYGITVTIRRVNTEGQGVHRVRKLGLRVSMTVNGNAVYSLQTLDNADVVTTQVAVSNQVSEVSMAVVDLCDNLLLGGSSNWVTGSAGRSNLLTEVMGSTGAAGVTDPGFIIKGNLGYICDEAYNAQALGKDASTMTLATAHLTLPGLDYNPAYGQTGTGAAARLNAVKVNVYNMCVSLPERRALTWDEMQEAIKRGTVWDKEAGGWTNGFTGTYVP